MRIILKSIHFTAIFSLLLAACGNEPSDEATVGIVDDDELGRRDVAGIIASG